MFFFSRPMRRSAAVLLALVPWVVDARLTSLFSSSVTYCSAPDSILVQQFDARYVKDNSSLVFDITASTLVKTLNVTAKITLNAYGLEPVDMSFNLCEVSKSLCPLPLYNFSGAGTIPIPAIKQRIPGIAYVVPDLEAAATLQLVDIGTNNVVACIQTTLSNGWSLRQRAVSWAIGGLVLITILVSVALTLWDVFTRSSSQVISSLSTRSSMATLALRNPRNIISTSPLLYRFFTLLILLQHIVSTALLDLNYPVAYRSFVVNFSWSFGLFASSLDSRLQLSMNNLRGKTGSKNANQGSLSATAYANRTQSPYNELAVASSSNPAATSELFITPATVTPSDTIAEGIPLLTNTIGIATNNAFLSLFYVVLIGIAILSIVLALGFGVVWLVRRKRGESAKETWTLEQRYWAGAGAIGLRAALISTAPILTLVFFQWTISDSWLAVLLSVLLFIIFSVLLVYTSYVLIASRRRRESVEFDLANQPPMYALSPYVEPYDPSRWFFTVYFLLPAIVLKCAFTSFPKGSGLTQVVAFIILSLTEVILLFVLRPYQSKRAHILEGFLAIAKAVISACLIAFVDSLEVKPIPRVAVAFVMVALESIAILVLFLNFVIDLVKMAVSGARWMLLPESEKNLQLGFNGAGKDVRGEDTAGPKGPWANVDLERSASGRPSSVTLAAPGLLATSFSQPSDSYPRHMQDWGLPEGAVPQPPNVPETTYAESTIFGSPRPSTSNEHSHGGFTLAEDHDTTMPTAGSRR